jgi:hypothetical protein
VVHVNVPKPSRRGWIIPLIVYVSLFITIILLGAWPAEAAVSKYNYRVVSSATPSARIPQLFVCDTEAERPAALVADGDLAYTKDTDIMWLRAAGAWVDITTGGGGGGAAINEPFVTYSATAGLSQERVLSNNAPYNTIDTATAGQVKIELSPSLEFLSDATTPLGSPAGNIGFTDNVNASVGYMADNSDNGVLSEALLSLQSNSSRIDVRSLSSGYAVSGDLLGGDGVVESSSRLFLIGGSIIAFGIHDPTFNEKMRLQDGLMVGTTTDPGVGIINVANGYRIGNTAAAGNFLVGNGANFVSTTPATANVAPANATYITQTASADLTGEQNLAALATGYMKSTTGTGVVTTQAIPIPQTDGGTGMTFMGIRATASHAISATAKTAITGMSVVLPVGNFSVNCSFMHTSNAVTVGVQLEATFTGTVTSAQLMAEHPSSATAVTWIYDSSFPMTFNALTDSATASTTKVIGDIQVATSGTFAWTHGSETATLTTVFAGSYCTFTKQP